jgi:hypothetical protein
MDSTDGQGAQVSIPPKPFVSREADMCWALGTNRILDQQGPRGLETPILLFWLSHSPGAPLLSSPFPLLCAPASGHRSSALRGMGASSSTPPPQSVSEAVAGGGCQSHSIRRAWTRQEVLV